MPLIFYRGKMLPGTVSEKPILFRMRRANTGEGGGVWEVWRFGVRAWEVGCRMPGQVVALYFGGGFGCLLGVGVIGLCDASKIFLEF